jgi:transcriptional regulator with XRE-family HTH domain
MITNSQIRAARALLGWSQRELADRSLLSETAILKLETAKADSRSSTIIKVRNTLEAAGIEFINHSDETKGVLLKKNS